MYSILLLPLAASFLETIDGCVWIMFVFMSVVVIVLWSMGMFIVQKAHPLQAVELL